MFSETLFSLFPIASVARLLTLVVRCVLSCFQSPLYLYPVAMLSPHLCARCICSAKPCSSPQPVLLPLVNRSGHPWHDEWTCDG
jgi:hypothetical protein